MVVRVIAAIIWIAVLSVGSAVAQSAKVKVAPAQTQPDQADPPVKIGAERLPDRLRLPGTKNDLKFDRKVARLDLENENRYAFYYKRGGTSIGFKIGKTGEKKSGKRRRRTGVFVPQNSSGNPESEVVSYRLSRLLGVSHLFVPATYYVLGPEATWRFKEMIRLREYDSFRQKNADRLRQKLKEDDGSLFGVYKHRPKRRTQSVYGIVEYNRFDTDHFLARYIKAYGSRPSNELVKLRGVRRDKKKFEHPRASKRELARQLSTIFVVDMLLGQWDRFSGTNLEAIAHKDGQLQFIARDNGGAGSDNLDWTWYRYYSGWVSRFDRGMISQLKQLNAFLQKRTPKISRFTDRDDLARALGFRSKASFRHFTAKLRNLMDRKLPALLDKYGEKVYFKNCSVGCEF